MTRLVDSSSVLFVTLDSCRYDSFCSAAAPHMKAVGELHCALAPSNFTFGSHSSMFVGFTPGVPATALPFVNPKFAKIFQMTGGGFKGVDRSFITLEGRNILEGFHRKGYAVLGTGAVGWFDPLTPTGSVLSDGFDEFFFSGNCFSLKRQIKWAQQHIERDFEKPIFLFMNIGETHVPYYFEGAPWDRETNPCVPFGKNNDAAECLRRQIACIEYIDSQLIDLIDIFSESTILICADHGDCWGEDGLWEHGISHPKVLQVPLLFRLGTAPS